MKNFNKSLVLASLTAVTMFTSCVDNAVEPEVKQLRAAQVAYVTAQANSEAADAEAKVIANTHAEAMNAIAVQSSGASLEVTLASLEVAKKNAEVSLKTAEMNLAVAIENYENRIAGGVDADGDLEYLEDYKAAASDLYTMVTKQITDETALAKEKITLASPYNTYDTKIKSLEAEIVVEQENIADYEAEIKEQEAIVASTTATDAEKQAAKDRIAELEAAIVTSQKAIQVDMDAIEGQKLDKAAAQSAIDLKQVKLDNLKIEITAQQTLVAKYKALLDAALAVN